MGFPVGYSELLLPKLLLQLILFLGLLRRVLSWAFGAVGLGDLLDPDAPWAPDAHAAPQPRPAPAVDDVLPVVRYDELRPLPHPRGGGESCAVCLHDLDGAAEVRRLANCRHVFHRGCLDRWMAHDQRTCPLCRAPSSPPTPPPRPRRRRLRLRLLLAQPGAAPSPPVTRRWVLIF
ncbi:RING-H2 zinc finger protein RHA1a [Ananas comosus]|uniref:RING-H2 zinc finger protein RHA1a n=1 Tax=Ananas comosus TaxID=4615 RepID=A0A199VFP6_ANACO|nr:RING-H2 zinc finger protein RHA1a [Ananas comosus]